MKEKNERDGGREGKEGWGRKKVIGMVFTKRDLLCVTKQRVCLRLRQEKHVCCCRMFNMRDKVAVRLNRHHKVNNLRVQGFSVHVAHFHIWFVLVFFSFL